jgi:hypothetical protein
MSLVIAPKFVLLYDRENNNLSDIIPSIRKSDFWTIIRPCITFYIIKFIVCDCNFDKTIVCDVNES